MPDTHLSPATHFPALGITPDSIRWYYTTRNINTRALNDSRVLAPQLGYSCSLSLLLIDIYSQYTAVDFTHGLINSFASVATLYIYTYIMSQIIGYQSSGENGRSFEKEAHVVLIAFPILPILSKLIHLLEVSVFAYDTVTLCIAPRLEVFLLLYNIIYGSIEWLRPIQSLTTNVGIRP
jgi:hypothetical protein